MNNAEKSKILQEMIDLTEPPHIESGDVTLSEYAERAGITRSSARNRLQKVVDKGLLETKIVKCPDGKHRRIYRLTG